MVVSVSSPPAQSQCDVQTKAAFSDIKIRDLWRRATKLLRLRSPNLKHYGEMPRFCRERHIQHGYRPNPSSVSYCITSAFHPTNETLNFWTHFLPLLFLMSRHYGLSRSLDWDSEQVKSVSHPFFAYSAGCCVLLGCSSFAHLFNCVSHRVRHLCFCSDYGAISIYSVGGTIVYFHLVSPPHCHGFDAGHCDFYIPFATALAVMAHIACCHTRFPHVKARYLLRTLAYVMPFVVISTPTLIRLSEHIPAYFSRFSPQKPFTVIPVVGADAITVTEPLTDLLHECFLPAVKNTTCEISRVPTILESPDSNFCRLGEGSFPFYYSLHLLFFLFAAFFNVSRFPEKNFPGRFDVIGSSHQLFHIAIALGIITQSVVVEEAFFDAIERHGVHNGSAWFATVSAWTTLGWLFFLTILLTIVVYIYGRLLPCRNH